MNGWQRNGRNPQWSNEQMVAALKRVYTKMGACGIAEYREHRLPDDPTHQGIIARFGTFNRAKIKAGLPICRKSGYTKIEIEPDEVELAPIQKTEYPCWKCHRMFLGIGRKNGNWHCENCTLTNNAQAANMAWLG